MLELLVILLLIAFFVYGGIAWSPFMFLLILAILALAFYRPGGYRSRWGP